MSWVYDKGAYLGKDMRVVDLSDDLMTVDSRTVPTSIALSFFKSDGWVIYNPTIRIDVEHIVFRYRTTFIKESSK